MKRRDVIGFEDSSLRTVAFSTADTNADLFRPTFTFRGASQSCYAFYSTIEIFVSTEHDLDKSGRCLQARVIFAFH